MPRPRKHAVAPPGVPVGIGAPPKHLGALAALWTELAAELPPGVACVSDRRGFEMLVRLTAQMQAGELRTEGAAQLRMLLAAFGMLPGSRVAAHIKSPEKDPYADIL